MRARQPQVLVHLMLALAVALLAACGPGTGQGTSTTATSTTSSEGPSATVRSTTATKTTEPTTTTTTDSEVIEIVVEDAEVVSGPERIEAGIGATVMFVVVSDAIDRVHVHGYDIFFDVAPGRPAEIRFTSDIPGIFEVEMEGSHMLLVELEIS